MSIVPAQLGVRRVVACHCALGEGLTWNPTRQAWFWLDIEAARIWMHRPHDDRTHWWSLPDRAGAFVFAESGAAIVGLAKSLVLADLNDNRAGTPVDVSPLVAVEPDAPHTRVNDGRTDREGRFVFGTMNEAEDGAAVGHFYQFSSHFGLRRLPIPAVTIANSLCCSPNGDTIYYCDSPRRVIMRGRYDSAAATVTDIMPFVHLPDREGMPDGSVVDADGGLWNAVWAGGVVRRYSPSGHLSHVVTLPAPNVTCPAFGGPGDSVLRVTTARAWMTDASLASHPEAGDLFEVIGLENVRGIAERPLDGL